MCDVTKSYLDPLRNLLADLQCLYVSRYLLLNFLTVYDVRVGAANLIVQVDCHCCCSWTRRNDFS